MPNDPKDVTVDTSKLLRNHPQNVYPHAQSNQSNFQPSIHSSNQNRETSLITSLNENSNQLIGRENFSKEDERDKEKR